MSLGLMGVQVEGSDALSTSTANRGCEYAMEGEAYQFYD